MVALVRGRPVGYLHVGGAHGDIDEIGWEQERGETAEQVFLAGSSYAAAQGMSAVAFWIDGRDEAGRAALQRTFGDTARTFVDPLGQAVDDCDPRQFLPQNWPEGEGLLVKFVNPGPGVLTGVDSTDTLTDAMARRSWILFDGDAS